MGDAGNVTPILVGIIMFVMVLSLVITSPSWSDTIDQPNMPEMEVPNPSSFLGQTYTTWNPIHGIHAYNNSVNISDNYWESSWTNLYGPNQANKSTFTDPANGNHVIDVRVIRDNIWYDPNSDGDSIYESAKKDYIAFDGYTTDLSLFLVWYSRCTFETIIECQADNENYSVVPLNAYNISCVIKTPGNASMHENYIWWNNYTLWIVQQPQMNYENFWTIVWWIISFNSAWCPSSPFIATVVSAAVDTTIGITLVRLAQGFIP